MFEQTFLQNPNDLVLFTGHFLLPIHLTLRAENILHTFDV
jgi:hypothetical protein